jgi:hypothetical protein
LALLACCDERGADQPSPHDAKLNIEGTKWLLIVMPEVERTPGKVVAYLVSTAEAVAATRAAQQAWLATEPHTAGRNTSWVLYFGKKKTPPTATDFQDTWSAYRLPGDVLIAPDGALVQTPGHSEARSPRTAILVLKDGTSENRRCVNEPDFSQNALSLSKPI